jgi:hypothetical protein
MSPVTKSGPFSKRPTMRSREHRETLRWIIFGVVLLLFLAAAGASCAFKLGWCPLPSYDPVTLKEAGK